MMSFRFLAVYKLSISRLADIHSLLFAMDNLMGGKMKFVMLLAIATTVTSLPIDQENSPQYIPQIIVDSYPREVVVEANHQDAELAKIAGDITAALRVRRNVESSNREINLANLSPAELAKLQIRVKGEITGTIPFASNPMTTLQEAAAEITQYRGSIWIRAEGSNKGGSVHIGGTVTFNEQELDKLMREELVKLGVKVDNAGNVIVIVESVEVEDVEILPSLELAESKAVIWSQKLGEKEAALSLAEHALRIKVRGKINVRIKFAADPAAQLRTAQLTQKNRGEVWVSGEASNRGASIKIGGTIRFSAEQLNAVEIEGIQVLPIELPAEVHLRKKD